MGGVEDAVGGLGGAFLLLVYWEIRARAARKRQQALQDEVRAVPELVVQRAGVERQEQDNTDGEVRDDDASQAL